MVAQSASSASGGSRRGRSARQSVIEAAVEIFVERGFEGTSIDLIAQRAKVSKPTIYSHFSGKEELFVEILGEACESLAGPMVGPEAESGELEAVLQSITRAYAAAVLTPRVIALHRLFVAEAERFPQLARRYYEAGPARAHRSFAAFLEARMRKGDIAEGDPLQLAQIFASMVINPFRSRLLFATQKELDPADVERHCVACVRVFLEGCRTRPPNARA